MAGFRSNNTSVVSSIVSNMSDDNFDESSMVMPQSPALISPKKHDINQIIGRTILDRRDVLKEIIYDYPETKKLVNLEEDDEAL